MKKNALCLVATHEKLFVIGGTDNSYNSLSSMQQLCNVDKKWKEVKSLNVPRHNFAAVACNNFIYAIGGYGSRDETNRSVEKYDAKADKWSFVKSMNISRWDHAACVLRGKIIVVGGNSDGGRVKIIESYDPTTDEWTVVGEIEEVAGYGIVAI